MADTLLSRRRSPSPTVRTGGSANRTGVTWAIGTMVISGVAIWVNRFGVTAWSDAGGSLAYTTAKNTVAALFLGALAWKMSASDLTIARFREHWRGLTAIAVFGGALPFAMFFEGLAIASSTQAAFIHKTLVLWVAALAIPLLGERIRVSHFVAIGALFGGQIVMAGGVAGIVIGTGELLILGATVLWSIEVIVAKRLLADVPPGIVAISRMGGGAVVLFGIGLVTGGAIPFAALDVGHVGWVVLTGSVLAAYVYTWLHALALAPATDVTAVLVGSVLITSLLDLGPTGLVAAGPGLAIVVCGLGVLIFGWGRGAVDA